MTANTIHSSTNDLQSQKSNHLTQTPTDLISIVEFPACRMVGAARVDVVDIDAVFRHQGPVVRGGDVVAFGRALRGASRIRLHVGSKGDNMACTLVKLRPMHIICM